ncbi:MAG: hypothetical protein A4E74_01574 [Syntrophus sp. PtaB.Bin075]|nr:MAG: hypothetical protein A4E74_01574 [Syntrophus sp. PtaB.Bin075]
MSQHHPVPVQEHGIPCLADLYLIHQFGQEADVDRATRHADNFPAHFRKNRTGGHAYQIARGLGPDHVTQIALPLHRLLEIIPIRGINPVIPALNSICEDNSVRSEQNDGFIAVSGGLSNPGKFPLYKGDFTLAVSFACLRHFLCRSHCTVGKRNILGTTHFLRQPQIDVDGQGIGNIRHLVMRNGRNAVLRYVNRGNADHNQGNRNNQKASCQQFCPQFHFHRSVLFLSLLFPDNFIPRH